ncbi:MAG TPA: AlkA N-terminal domain-containing protein [Solirubrobacteraceae bacterium]|nr:AlkA N-terminal domain-containing protein [Solirubrobacteraceae bacterium]
MSGFSGVVTTGIYCRPGCGARPHERNVRPFATAAAAEAAGYRACLRCRPYRSEPPLSWSAPELVCRAVQLVLDGGLDDGCTEHDLGARLGISARHLRRLFATHLGASPDQLARSRRAHFARRLLDDTDMTVTQVAFASGFRSVRQLNRACHELFRGAPRELRARRRVADRLVTDGGLALRLPYQPPLDWEVMLSYFRARAIAGVEDVSEDVYRRTVMIDGDPGVIELSRGSEEHLLLRAHLPHWEGLIHHAQRARRVFNLDADMGAVLERLGGDPLLGQLLQVRPGLRAPGAWDPFEIGVRAIVGQQVSVAAANGIIARLVARTGMAVPGLRQLRLTHLFPAPSDLAHADLGGLGLTAARARAVGAFARAVAAGHIDLDRSRTLEELTGSITATAGLGPWTAHYVALRLGEPDAFPAGDLGLRRALARATGDSVTTSRAAQLAEPWSPHRAHAAAHLWLAQATPRLSRRAGSACQ